MNPDVITTAPVAGKPLPKASQGLEENLTALGSYKLLKRAQNSENYSLLEFTVQVIKLHASNKSIPQKDAWGRAT